MTAYIRDTHRLDSVNCAHRSGGVKGLDDSRMLSLHAQDGIEGVKGRQPWCD